MIRLGDLFEKPKIELFLDSPDTEFYNSCRLRENEIKKTFAQAFRTFNIHVEKIGKDASNLPKWKKERVKLCMTNLGDYMEELIGELNKEKIENYCKSEEKLGDKYIPFMPDIILLMINSYHGAVETDLHWVTDLSLSDSIDISIGDFNFTKLEKYLPKRISELKILLQDLKSNICVSPYIDSINEALICFESKHVKASNLLLITTNEGLVRSLGIYLKEKQGLSVNPLDKRKYASLESFLKNIPWKKDLKINGIQYGLITGNYSMNKSQTLDSIFVSLNERLGFLCRRFKENRNTILHGEETNYSNSLNSFLNFSALKETLTTIKDYDKLYSK